MRILGAGGSETVQDSAALVGECAVVIMDAEFEHSDSIMETVTVNKSSDEWQVVGYIVK
ncbi:DUF4019 domain-containing protein [Pseudomonas sp. OIL-1]|uniref:DUF4019 domain-containing protein n=1 Tax=Pseudomonas sp. OIL-1 TaxID=2706126 RepID=UPI0035325BEF